MRMWTRSLMGRKVIVSQRNKSRPGEEKGKADGRMHQCVSNAIQQNHSHPYTTRIYHVLPFVLWSRQYTGVMAVQGNAFLTREWVMNWSHWIYTCRMIVLKSLFFFIPRWATNMPTFLASSSLAIFLNPLLQEGT